MKKVSEAKRRANDKYDKANMRVVTLSFHRRSDADILEKLEQEESKIGYIRKLINEDMKRGNK